VLGVRKKTIFVGGGGRDTFTGSEGDDILIAGATIYDNNNAANRAAWCAIVDEWVHGKDYKARVQHLTGATAGGLNGPYLLNYTTVVDDHDADYLMGNKGKDFFIAHTFGGNGYFDTISTPEKDEQVLNV